MKIYISIPISGQHEPTQRRKVLMWQLYFEGKGHRVSNPFDIKDRLEKFHENMKMDPPTYRDYMTEDIAELITNDAIFFVGGWENSKGCIEEAEHSLYFKLKVMFERTYDIT